MISKNTIKFIKSLQLKKNRQESNAFVVEGLKSVKECLLSEYQVLSVYFTSKCESDFESFFAKKNIDFFLVSSDELQSISTLENNFTALAVVQYLNNKEIILPNSGISLALDNIQDPGNLGTIIRTADWFGIKHIFCSTNTVDMYGLKVISATMGSFLRVNVQYVDLKKLLSSTSLPIIAAAMSGVSPSSIQFKNGLLLMGNEANGVSSPLLELCTDCVTIPKIGQAESLNVAIATGILLHSFTSK